MSTFEQTHVIVKLVARHELAAEALDRHIGQCEELIEYNPIAGSQLFLVGLLQLDLVGWQTGAKRVVDQIQDAAATGQSVTQSIEFAQTLDAALKGTVATLRVYILFEVAR